MRIPQQEGVFLTIDRMASAGFSDRGSKFIGYAYPLDSVDRFKTRLQEIKKEHPKATHHCFAYRIGADGDIFRSADDGEPSGTAGRPILAQIDSRGLTNIVVFVVRYFGGTLLGTSGLIHAYKTATSLVLQTVPIIQRSVEKKFLLQFDYTITNQVLQILKQSDITIVSQEMQLFCSMEISVPVNKIEIMQTRFADLQGLSSQML